jgi:hypothetical protein
MQEVSISSDSLFPMLDLKRLRNNIPAKTMEYAVINVRKFRSGCGTTFYILRRSKCSGSHTSCKDRLEAFTPAKTPIS